MKKVILVFVLTVISITIFSQKKIDVINNVNLSKIDKKFLRKFDIRKDPFEKTTSIYPKVNRSIFMPFIFITKDNTAFLMLVANCYSNDWIFMEKIIVLINDKPFEIPLKNSISRKILDDGVMESCYIDVSDKILSMLKEIASSKKEVSIKYLGNSYGYASINRRCRKAINKIITLFDKLSEIKEKESSINYKKRMQD